MSEVGERLRRRLPEVLAASESAYRTEIPEYDALSDEEMRSTVLPISRAIAETFIASLEDGRPPRVEDAPGLDTIGIRRVRMGMPLEPMLHAFRVFGRVVWTEMAGSAGPGDADLLAELGVRWMDWIDRASSSAATAYLDASNELVRRLDARRGALLEALLEASAASEVTALATEFQTTFAEQYHPVVLVGDDVAIRIDDIVAVAPAGTIVGNRSGSVWLLSPELPDLDRLQQVGDAELVVAGTAAAPGGSLVLAAHEAQELLVAAGRVGRRGVVGPGDLVLERLVSGADPPARWFDDNVIPRLRAGDRTGNLEQTLAVYLQTGSVPATARAVHAHGNTVAYRLGRVAQLTGFDPRRPEEATVLHLGLLRAALTRPSS